MKTALLQDGSSASSADGPARNDIAVADQADPALDDAPAHCPAQQGGKLLDMTVIWHRPRQRAARARGGVEIDFADPVGQVREQAEKPRLRPRATPGEPE